jgi:hypothetical protein
MKIELWPIDKLIPYARNARKIPQAAIDKVAASIKEFGWRQPIVVDADRVPVASRISGGARNPDATGELLGIRPLLSAVVAHAPADSWLVGTGALGRWLTQNRRRSAGVQHATPASFPHAVRGTLAPILLGRFTRPLNGTWLISTPGSAPAVQLPAGMIVSVSC